MKKEIQLEKKQTFCVISLPSYNSNLAESLEELSFAVEKETASGFIEIGVLKSYIEENKATDYEFKEEMVEIYKLATKDQEQGKEHDYIWWYLR